MREDSLREAYKKVYAEREKLLEEIAQLQTDVRTLDEVIDLIASRIPAIAQEENNNYWVFSASEMLEKEKQEREEC